jgi:hypothetical protein
LIEPRDNRIGEYDDTRLGGLKYSGDLILLEVTFISGRPKEKRLALLKALNETEWWRLPESPRTI